MLDITKIKELKKNEVVYLQNKHDKQYKDYYVQITKSLFTMDTYYITLCDSVAEDNGMGFELTLSQIKESLKTFTYID